MIEKSTHDSCPNCPNNVEDDRIYLCDEGYLFCQKCAESNIGGYLYYRDCRVHADDYIGWIGPPTDAPQDLKEWDICEKYDSCPRCKCNRRETKVFQCYDGHKFCQACQRKQVFGDLVQCGEPHCTHWQPMPWCENGCIIP